MRGARLAACFWFCIGAIAALWATNLCLSLAGPSASTNLHGRDVTLSAMTAAVARGALQRPRVVASMTTFPLGSRMSFVEQALLSLANQSWPLDSVIINFADKVPRISEQRLDIPPIVDTWRRRFPFLNARQTHDRGPATKLLGALEVETEPDTIIIILDDDTSYHRDTVLALVSSMVASPVDVAPCFRCEEVHPTWDGRWRWWYQEKEGTCNGFASGYSAYAVRPRFFKSNVWEVEQGPKGCWIHDDVWISGSMLVATGVRPRLLRPGFDPIVSFYEAQAGQRQQESVFVANKAAHDRGEDPQGDCVGFFPFSSDANRPIF